MDARPSVNKGAQDTQCPAGPFETDLARISSESPRPTPPVASQQQANDAIPVEISRISDGAVSKFRGGLMNEGMTTWYAFDAERRLFVAVLTSTGSKGIPSSDKLASNQLLRFTDAAGYRRSEYVTVITATAEQVKGFGCIANRLVAAGSDSGTRPTPADTAAKSLTLLIQGKTLPTGDWEVEGELERFIKGPLQEAILGAL